MNPALLAAIIASLAAVAFLAWALMERSRANRAEARAWEAAQRGSDPAQIEILRAQAAEQANAVAKALIERTDETFRAREEMSRQKLEAQLKPVAETLAKVQEQVAAVEKVRIEDATGLKAQITALMEASMTTQNEARKLSTALRRGVGVQGQWGEQMLRNVLELAGLRLGYDFHEQVTLDGEGGRLRPDVVVKMPGNAAFVIDAKCALTAYLEIQDAVDEITRAGAIDRHAASIRTHAQQLAGKAYWDALEVSPDFVVMFVPGDGILASALERNPGLMNEAMEKRVILATPSVLFALCKAVAYGWRIEEQSKNAVRIADLGKELHKRVADMASHAAGVGKALGAAVDRYNSFVGSLEARVLPKAREFEKLKADSGADIPDAAALDHAVRPITRVEIEDEASPEKKPRQRPSLTVAGP